jgi:hypothetical protein
MKLHIDSLEMVDKARHYLMRRGMYPNAVLNSTDVEGAEELNDDQIERIRGIFENDHQGVENWGRLFVAYAGYRLEKWGDPPSEMAFEQGWEQLSSFILGGGFGITKPAAGMVEDSSYQTLFATLKQLHLLTLDPECDDIGSDLSRTLCPHWGDDLFIHVRVPRIDDHELTFTAIDKATTAKCITKNETRMALSKMNVGLNLPLTKEDWGKDFAGSEPQEQQQPAPGMGGEVPQEGAQNTNDSMAALSALAGGENQGQEEEAAPSTGGLSDNSLGPKPGSQVQQVKRFTLRPTRMKSFYELGREVICNGTH